jgi:hypothetical protein
LVDAQRQREVPAMKFYALFVAAVLLAWISLTYVQLRTTRRGMLWLWLLPKVAAGTFSLETAPVGMEGLVGGTVSGSRSHHLSGKG